MKNVLILSLSFLALCAYSIEKIEVTAEVDAAVKYIYEQGRMNSDVGGFSSIEVYKYSEETDAQIVDAVMFEQDFFSESFETAGYVCEEYSPAECIQLVMNGSEHVRSSHGFTDAQDFLNNMRGWEIEGDTFVSSISTVEDYLQKTLGSVYTTYSYGYDDIGDVFTIIMISRKNGIVIVMTGDYGA